MPATAPLDPVRYHPAIERPEPGEAETGAAIVKAMRGINETTFKDYGHAVRAVHAKAHGLINGTLRVLDGLPPALAQGLFATPGATHPVLMRISTIPGDVLDDNISVPRGLAIKVMNVDGERLPGWNAPEQDFLMVNGPAFAAQNAKAFLGGLKLLAGTTDRVAWLKRLLSEVTRPLERILKSVTGRHTLLVALGGHPATNPLGETYYSQAPLLYGLYIAKVSLVPVSPALAALKDAPVALRGKTNALREAVVDFFRGNGGEWELRVQLCTDLKTMPVEDASVVWPEDQSPYIAVARIAAAPQNAWSDDNVRHADGALSFSPWHGLAAHRPLGSIMRVRKAAYDMSARFRVEHNGP